jgi:divalent metal cation (Fe/Co/Zn/Cd) transporter
MGRSLLLEIDMQVSATTRVGDAGRICRQVETAIFAAVPAVRQVTCHVSSGTSSAARD